MIAKYVERLLTRGAAGARPTHRSGAHGMNIFERLLRCPAGHRGHPIFWREVVGNIFGFASAIGGMRRRVWAWPVGIVGNAILFTVFFGVAFANPQGETLYGQAGRQVFFILAQHLRVVAVGPDPRRRGGAGADVPAVTPRWATTGSACSTSDSGSAVWSSVQWLFSP